jgi:hypothetical protein
MPIYTVDSVTGVEQARFEMYGSTKRPVLIFKNGTG